MGGSAGGKWKKIFIGISVSCFMDFCLFSSLLDLIVHSCTS